MPGSTRRSSIIEGVDAIAEAVVLCFASAVTARALDYRLHVGLPVDHIGIAILIQAQILADSAGVVFSANPITGSLAEVVSRAIGEKRLMTVPVPGGTRELETPALLRDLPSVTDALVLELAALALRLETDTGAPVDIECAVKGNDVYLLQSRPITALRAAGVDGSDS